MLDKEIRDYSSRLKEIAKDLSFLGHPRFPVHDLKLLFPQHHIFINELEDVTVPFPVDVSGKRRAMDQFVKDLAISSLPPGLKDLFNKRIEDYRLLLTMMENFDTQVFYQHSIKLYGSSSQHAHNNALYYFLEKIPEFCVVDRGEEKLQGEVAMQFLRENMQKTFLAKDFDVKASTSLLSDSSAGRRVLKLNPFKAFTKMQLEVFLVHEGWVHLGTSLNGQAQTDHLWLSTWAPRTTYLQEGLAILTELIMGCMTLERWNKVILRHLATTMAEKGSSIKDVYNYLRHHDMEPLDSFKLALRVFRGVPLEGGGAFTKELLYLHGLIELLRHLEHNNLTLRSLWMGKMSFEEHLFLLRGEHGPQADLRYFPSELDSSDVQNRLQKLKELSFSLHA
jgi:uncharacterized protein (TIGR02421 family)